MTDNKKRWIRSVLQICGIAALIGLDQLIKSLVEQKLKGSGPRVLIPGFLGLCYAENTGAAFSLFASSTAALTAITGVVLLGGLIALIVIRKKPLIYDICVPLIIAGGAGNQLDRLTRGYVIDYIQTLFIDFPIFNFADCLITCACFAVIIYLICEIITDGRKKTAAKETPDD